MIIFADDTNAFGCGKKLDELVQMVNSELKNLSDWFNTNKLSLNIDKTQYIIFSKIDHIPNVNIEIDGKKINRVFHAKFLGVTIDSKLNWHQHIQLVCKKVFRNLGVINRLRRYLPSYILPRLYLSLILPHIEYCIIV